MNQITGNQPEPTQDAIKALQVAMKSVERDECGRPSDVGGNTF